MLFWQLKQIEPYGPRKPHPFHSTRKLLLIFHIQQRFLKWENPMSSISQSILMALAVTLNKFASSNVQSVQRNQGKRPTTTSTATVTTTVPVSVSDTGRRGLLLSAVGAAAAPQVIDSRTELLKRYLKKSEENKEKNDKERLDNYYKRNYKDYFEFVEGSLRNKSELSESEKGIIEWLKKNK